MKMYPWNAHELTPNVPHQSEIDAAAAAMLYMTPAEAKLIEAVAWTLAKDAGLDDWREALEEARKVCNEWIVSRPTQET